VNEVIQAAAKLQAICTEENWQFCFIGGLAVQRWGEPRETVDVDLTLLTGFGHEEQFIQILLRHYEGRIPEAAEFARERRVLLLRAPNGVGLDIALAGLPFEELLVHRSSFFHYPTAGPLSYQMASTFFIWVGPSASAKARRFMLPPSSRKKASWCCARIQMWSTPKGICSTSARPH